MIAKRFKIFTGICLFAVSTCFGQTSKISQLVNLFNSKYYGQSTSINQSLKNSWLKLSISKNVLDYQTLSYSIDALNAMYQVTNNAKYLEDNLVLINNVINSSTQLTEIKGNLSEYKDNYYTWVVLDTAKRYSSLYMKETSLSEVYFFQYVTSLLYLIKKTPSLYVQPKFRNFYEQTLKFTEKNVWEKWYTRGLRLGMAKGQYLGGRTHIGSHWAFIANMLNQLSNDQQLKDEYLWTSNTYNKILKGNFRVNPKMPSTLIWNSTYDLKGISSILNNSQTFVQDVSHGNLVVSYIVNANSLNLFWTKKDITNLCKLLGDYLWDKSNYTFLDNLDGSTRLQTSSRGIFQSDGWVKLGRYNRRIQNIYWDYIQNNSNSYAKDAQLYANMALNEKILLKKGL